MTRLLTLFIFVCLTCSVPASLSAQGVAGDQATLIRAGLIQSLEAGRLDDVSFVDAPDMRSFYEAREFEPAWIGSGLFSKSRDTSILQILESAWEHGLNPQDYHVVQIRSMLDQKGGDRFRLELLISDALIRFGRDLTGMRVDPKSIGQKSKYWRQPLRGIDILSHVATGQATTESLRGLMPDGQLYKSLQKELKRLLVSRESEQQEDVIKVHVDRLIRPGQTHKSIFKIRQRMGFDVESPSQEALYYYDDILAQAVMAFQKSQGLKPDGIIGPHTVKLMNITTQDKIDQILVNLERLRWVEPQKPARYVMVNIPSATLWAVEKGSIALEMPVVVGREKRPTKSFTTSITGIRFNPTWTVPPTIKRDDYLPALRKDPYYLSDRGIDLVENGMTVDPGTIDWTAANWSDVNKMRMVQGSGKANPLGQVRVIMDNPYNIYLHDTPSKGAFAMTDRALSSGCVRMAEAEKFADFVLKPNENWSEDRKTAILSSGKQTEISAAEPLPVYILYQTIWLGERGQVIYGQDLYGEDKSLLALLKKQGKIYLPPLPEKTVTAQGGNELSS